jgi:hypothetical protein
VGGAISFCATKTEDAPAFFALPHPVFASVLRDLGRSVLWMFASCFFVANIRIRFLVSPIPRLTVSKFNLASKRSASTGAPALTRGVMASLTIAIRCGQQSAVLIIRNRCSATFAEIG